MANGVIPAGILTRIANAIRYQNGSSEHYRPGDMAEAVAGLDGSAAGPGPQEPEASGWGVVNDYALSYLAEAIRYQNGSDARYTPSEMPDAILALTWDTGLKPRALLLSDGTLEFNYLERRGANYDGGSVVEAWEVSASGYSSATARPWHTARSNVKRVYFDPSFKQAGCADISHFLEGMTALTDVYLFGNVGTPTKAASLFSGCSELRTVWDTGSQFDASALTSCSMAFYGCSKLVGGHLATAKSMTGKAGFSTGDAGLLTDANDDQRLWVKSYLYADGGLVITHSGGAEAGRTLAASGTICGNARYTEIASTPWSARRDTITSVTFANDMSDIPDLSLDYWFANCKSSEISFSGWSRLDVASMEFCFNGCIYLQELDLTGLDASGVSRWTYAFAGMSALRTIRVSPRWKLPTTLASKANTFYNDPKLVGGNGTAYSSTKTGADMAVIDKDGQPGYLTSA